ncbi:XRE family transcriptional regulator [Sphaerisporangium sp. NPDC051011]|uniref:XRE family transcriptional regulator n=1 Tax=Sphaerisporangium sp. NPDC051011 TaxID=3155792 RepID=UPI0033EA65F0
MSVEQTVRAILADLQPEMLPLEAWRLAYGWSRPQCLAAILRLYEADGLAEPALNSSMLCKWEHGKGDPGPEYGGVLCRLYGVSPNQLGLRHLSRSASVLSSSDDSRYVAHRGSDLTVATKRQATMADAALEALRESIELALEVEGPGGGALAREHLGSAVGYYALHYSRFTPGLLALEVHRTRALVGRMLRQPQTDVDRRELRRLAGWLSALVGNLAFHLADYPAAGIHFATAARLGTAVGQNELVCWSLGAQAMTAYTQDRPAEALDLARQALEYADTPLRRAQILAWAQLRSQALLGQRQDAIATAAAAQDEMAADSHGEQPGRFGFDLAELELHLSEAALLLSDHEQARAHAAASLQHVPVGRPGWATATLLLARGEVARGQYSDGAALALNVLSTVEPDALRETTRLRLRALNQDLFGIGAPGAEARELAERVRSLAPLVPVPRISDEPNGIH